MESVLDELRLRCVGTLLFLFLSFLILSLLVSLLDKLLPADWPLSSIPGVLSGWFRVLGSYVFFYYLPIAVLDHRTRWGEHVVAFYETRVGSGPDEATALRGLRACKETNFETCGLSERRLSASRPTATVNLVKG